MLYREAKAAIFFINITDKNGYESSFQLLRKKFEKSKIHADKDIIFCIAFTHCDSEWVISFEEIKRFAIENNILLFMLSSKRPETITSMFQLIANNLIKKYPQDDESQKQKKSKRDDISDKKKQSKKRRMKMSA